MEICGPRPPQAVLLRESDCGVLSYTTPSSFLPEYCPGHGDAKIRALGVRTATPSRSGGGYLRGNHVASASSPSASMCSLSRSLASLRCAKYRDVSLRAFAIAAKVLSARSLRLFDKSEIAGIKDIRRSINHSVFVPVNCRVSKFDLYIFHEYTR